MNSSMRWQLLSLSTAALVSAACGSQPDPTPEPQGERSQALSVAGLDCLAPGNDWPMFGQNVCGTRSATTVGPINTKTVGKLAVKWTYKAGGDISATPAVVGNEVYVPDWSGLLNKIDAQTGKAIWSVSVASLLGGGSDAGLGPGDTPPNVVSRDTPVVFGSSVIFGVSRGDLGFPQTMAVLVAVDRATGALKWKTTIDSHITAQITSSPVLDGGRLYVGVASFEEFWAALPVLSPGATYPCCSFRGSVAAVDAETGRVLWKTYTIDDSAYYEADGVTPSGFAGGAVWSTPAIDRIRGSLYVTTGNNYAAPPGTSALPPGDHIESVMSLDLRTGAIKWSQRMTMGDVWNLYYYLVTGPESGGPDYDFGAGANLFSTRIHGVPHDVVGAGQKSGIYWALDPDTGNVLWNTAVGPGGHLGGIHWGTAVDGQHVYAQVNDETGSPYALGGSGAQAGQMASVGSWAALDPGTGAIDWQVADPAMTAPIAGSSVNGPVSAVNGVVFGGSMDTGGTMFAFDGATGQILWSFASGATVYGGPAIADGVVYWGNGYPNARLLFGTPGGTLYAFQIAR